jgi:flagellar hook-basal body complex protein FliE
MPAISPLPPITGLPAVSGPAPTAVPTGDGTTGASFGSVLGGAVQNLTDLQRTADGLAVKAVTGDLTDIHQATLAATRAQVTMELVSAVRNKGVDAFNEIMRMQA